MNNQAQQELQASDLVFYHPTISYIFIDADVMARAGFGESEINDIIAESDAAVIRVKHNGSKTLAIEVNRQASIETAGNGDFFISTICAGANMSLTHEGRGDVSIHANIYTARTSWANPATDRFTIENRGRGGVSGEVIATAGAVVVSGENVTVAYEEEGDDE